MKDFKFLQQNKEERVFTQWMDDMDDYHLGGIQRVEGERDVRMYHLNVMWDINRRIPHYSLPFEQEVLFNRTCVAEGNIEDLINGRFGVIEKYLQLTIRRGGPTQDTFSSYTVISYNSVNEVNTRGLIFQLEDRVIVRYKLN